jgi:hypothetical protein
MDSGSYDVSLCILVSICTALSSSKVSDQSFNAIPSHCISSLPMRYHAIISGPLPAPHAVAAETRTRVTTFSHAPIAPHGEPYGTSLADRRASDLRGYAEVFMADTHEIYPFQCFRITPAMVLPWAIGLLLPFRCCRPSQAGLTRGKQRIEYTP